MPKGIEEQRVNLATEAATKLLGLPWELLHDSRGRKIRSARIWC